MYDKDKARHKLDQTKVLPENISILTFVNSNHCPDLFDVRENHTKNWVFFYGDVENVIYN